MSVPTWLSDALQEPGDDTQSIADVDDIITRVRLNLVTNGNWTEPSAGLFKCVPTAAGVWFDILLTRIDADTLEFRTRDHNANTINSGRIDIAAAGNTTVDHYWGNQYLVIESVRATSEVFQAYVLDPSAVGAVDGDMLNRVVGQCYRDTAGTGSGTRVASAALFAWDNAVATQLTTRDRFIGQSTSTNIGMLGPGGRFMFIPMVCSVNQAGTEMFTGCLPMTMACSSTLAFATVKQVPVDTGTNKAFKVLRLSSVNNQLRRQCIRMPSQDV